VRPHRMLAPPPARALRAFTDPDALVRWMPPCGSTARQLEIAAGVGYRRAFSSFSTGDREAFRMRFVDLSEDELLRRTATVATPACRGRGRWPCRCSPASPAPP